MVINAQLVIVQEPLAGDRKVLLDDIEALIRDT
jgi:hypothetical protein